MSEDGYPWAVVEPAPDPRDKRIAELERALSDMTLMRDILLSQLKGEGIDPLVRANMVHVTTTTTGPGYSKE